MGLPLLSVRRNAAVAFPLLSVPVVTFSVPSAWPDGLSKEHVSWLLAKERFENDPWGSAIPSDPPADTIRLLCVVPVAGKFHNSWLVFPEASCERNRKFWPPPTSLEPRLNS